MAIDVPSWSCLRFANLVAYDKFHVPIEIRCAIIPPHRPALAERPLGVVDGMMGGNFRVDIGRSFGIADSAPGIHQPVNGCGLPIVRNTRIGHAPKPPADEEASTVWCDRMFQAGLGRCRAADFMAANRPAENQQISGWGQREKIAVSSWIWVNAA
ncbi:hypothetical protein ACKWRH_05805 [Bradyrhizobium sp. Pa8]|uniref:hypothetical protein n=1 Tax=Bradyrhizobium sp. Pa8 TaxID=3386552 RepID=UPI00403F9C8E